MTKAPQHLSRDDTPTGWLAHLNLTISRKHDKSVISKSRQQGPLTVQSSLYPEGSLCHIYLLHPPAGIVGGDRLCLEVVVQEEGQTLITTPGATKFYRSNGKPALQQQYLKVASGCSLEWLPQETIYYPNTHARMETVVELEPGARFIGSEIHCLGLPARGESMEEGRASIRLQIRRNKKPLFLEGMMVTPEKRERDRAFLNNSPVFGSFYATGADRELLNTLREQLPELDNGLWGVTLIEDLLIVRYVGEKTWQAQELFTAAWKVIRPAVLKMSAQLPRIWNT